MIGRRLLVLAGLLFAVAVPAGVLAVTGDSCGAKYDRDCTAQDAPHIVGTVVVAFTAAPALLALVFGVILARLQRPGPSGAAVPLIGRRAYERLALTGRPAYATVQAVTPSVMRINNDRLARVDVWVEPLDGAPAYLATCLLIVPWMVPPRPGQRFPASVDPSNPHRVALEWTAALRAR